MVFPLHVGLIAPLLELCSAHGALVSVHTWFYPSQAYPWLAPIEAFPGVHFVLAHTGYRQWPDAVIVAERAPNVFVETSLQLPGTIRKIVDKLGPERILFGSNAPYAFPDVELRALSQLGLHETELELICGANLARLLPTSPAPAMEIRPMPLEYVITGDEVIFEGRPAYSAAVVAGQTVYLAGQTAGRGADGLVIGQGDIELQAETVYRKLGETLARVGATFAHVVKITVYATRAEFRQPLSATRARFLPQPPPATRSWSSRHWRTRSSCVRSRR